MKIQFISAGAGTGKTHRVTEIIATKLADGTCRPTGLVATTFTKKAAHELAERIRGRLFAQGKSGLAQRMEEALIGTVHGVCQRLLGRFAFEAGISPRLEVLGEGAAEILLNEALESMLSREEIQKLQRLGERLTQHQLKNGKPAGLAWKKTIKKLLDLSRSNGFQAEDLPGMAERSCEELLAHFGPETGENLDQLWRAAIAKSLQDITGNGDETKGTREYCDELRATLRSLEREELSWADWIRLSKAVPSKPSIPASDPVRRIAARYEEHPALRGDICAYTRHLYTAAARTLQQFQALKESRGMLDFTDLEQRTLALLALPSVQSALTGELDLVVVDEFQDTSPMQLAIFLKLAELAKGSFWVGDVKQAIYGFRGTDPELIAAVVNQLGLDDRLTESWRSVPDLVAVTNALFCPAFQTSLGMSTADVALIAHRSAPSHGAPALEFFELTNDLVNKGDGLPKKLEKDRPAKAITEGVRQLLSATPRRMVADRSPETGLDVFRPVRPRDVAVLCRDNDEAAKIAGQLVAAGYSVSFSRAGLLATPEATLALACLRRLADPEDVLATAEILALQRNLEPEVWLESRLEYLATREQMEPATRADRWGIESPLADPTVIALHEAHALFDLASPSESLDLALARGKVADVVTSWGPDAGRGEQRRANLEALRALARRYEDDCLTTHSPATVAGFLFWCDDAATAGKDAQASDPEADSIQVVTYHSAKGLEWPVVVCTQLDSPLKPGLWQPMVVKDSPDAKLDLAKPLAGRRLRFWASPFGQQAKDVALRTRIEDGPAAQARRSLAVAEELRLLYVGFTRARDLLVPVVEKGRSQPWLEGLQAAWFRSSGKQLNLPSGAVVPCDSRTLTPPEGFPSSAHDTRLLWFPEARPRSARLPARLVPSKVPEIPTAEVVETIELGLRLPTQGHWEDATLGDAMHSLIATEFAHPDVPNRAIRTQRLLDAHGLAANLSAADVLAAVDRFKATVVARFQPSSILTEVPFTSVNAEGQQLMGFMDLVLETAAGWVVIDHKTFPGPRSKWREEALSYSGQLTAYAEALTKSGRTVAGVWVHFVVGGGLLRVAGTNP